MAGRNAERRQKMNKKILVAQLGVGNIRDSEYAYFSSDGQMESFDQVDHYIQFDEKNRNCYPFLAYLDTAKDEKFTDLMLIGTMMSLSLIHI